MCGIVGIVGAAPEAAAADMLAALAHRGPDAQALHHGDAASVGAARLSIVDPKGGAQPMFNEAGDTCIVFNGEIYNHRALRRELEDRGCRFRTGCDTEVVLRLYEKLGEHCVDRLEGMFAFAILDPNRLFLARDPLGIKPLYYAHLPESGLFLFASEVKALLQCNALTPRLNRQALAHYLILRHSVGPETYIEGILSLPPGHVLTVARGTAIAPGEPRRYASVAPDRHLAVDEEGAEELLFSTLLQAVETHLEADVEVALTLSGGLDSTILALLAHRLRGSGLTTFTVGDDPNNADMRSARAVAAAIGARHREVEVGFDDYVAAIPHLIAAEEKPNSLFGMPLFLLCRAMSGEVKAALHGEGADELFGGYEDYVDRAGRLATLRERLPLLRALDVMPSPAAIAIIHDLSHAASMDEYLHHTFRINLRDPLEQFHLCPTDKVGMASGVELRVPYLSGAVCALANSLPIELLVRPELGIGKLVLKWMAIKRLGASALNAVLRPKHGFPSAGMRHLARFEALCDDLLPDRYVEGHPMGQAFPSKRNLVLFDMFADLFCEHRGVAEALGDPIDYIRARASGGARHAVLER